MKTTMNKTASRSIIFCFLVIVSCFVLFPIIIVIMNSFKGRLFISSEPFKLPIFGGDNATFVGIANYVTGIDKIKFFQAFGYSLWITCASVVVILLISSMIAWFILRIKYKFTIIFYFSLIF